jgi:hypothetical protein
MSNLTSTTQVGQKISDERGEGTAFMGGGGFTPQTKHLWVVKNDPQGCY